MDTVFLQVFEELRALSAEDLSRELARYRDDPLAVTLQFLDECSREDELFSKNDIEIKWTASQPQVKDEDLSDWEYAANDGRFALAA